jgi:branched-chain amino acid transport system ATP-binding protein
MLRVEGLAVSYGKAVALDGVSLTVEAGACSALIGPNGAGKTTLLRAISALVRPERGEIWLDGERIDGQSPRAVVRRGVVHCPEGRRLAPHLTVAENLALGAFLRTDRAGIERDRAWIVALFPRLGERTRQLAGTLSGGEQQMLAIGRALMARPRLLMLDEPSLGLAPVVRQRIFASVKEIRDTGVTVLLVEQDARQALRISEKTSVLEHGRVVLEGASAELARSDYVRQVYLGL